MKYNIIINGKKMGSVETNDINDYAAKTFPQGYEVRGNKLIVNSISLGEAMKIGLGIKV